MQPCEVCGAVGVDAAGCCVQCRTFRGTGQGYPEYPAPPVSVAPITSPITPGGYPGPVVTPPGYPGAPPPRQRSPYVIPLIVACVAIVVVAAGIVVAVVAKSVRSSNVGGPGGAGNRAGQIDSCIVGSWALTRSTQQLDTGLGTIAFDLQTPGSETTTVAADGTAVDSYHQTGYQGTSSGLTVTLTVTGTVHYTVRSNNGTLTFLTPEANGTITTRLNGNEVTTEPLQVKTDPASYTCNGDTLTEHTSHVDATLTRQN